jgi:hypothetical protein
MSYPQLGIFRNGNDFARLPVKTTSRLKKQAAFFAWSAKALNLRADSKYGAAVIFLAVAKNRFINRLRLSRAKRNFRRR